MQAGPSEKTKQRRARAEELRDRGFGVRDIAAALEVSINVVYYLLTPENWGTIKHSDYATRGYSKVKVDTKPYGYEPPGPRAEDHRNMAGVRYDDVPLKPSVSKPVNGVRMTQVHRYSSNCGCAAALCVES